MNDKIYESGHFYNRLPSHFQRSFKLEIYAVGSDVQSALFSLGESLNWGEIEDIEFQSHEDAPCEWYVCFYAGGTSMKASGEYVTGGVIVTWWK